MESEPTKESWDDLKAKLKQKLTILTDNELKFEDDKTTTKSSEPQIYHTNTKEELQRIIMGM